MKNTIKKNENKFWLDPSEEARESSGVVVSDLCESCAEDHLKEYKKVITDLLVIAERYDPIPEYPDDQVVIERARTLLKLTTQQQPNNTTSNS